MTLISTVKIIKTKKKKTIQILLL